MQSYELMIIFRSDLKDATEKAVRNLVETFIGKIGLQIDTVSLLGKKLLAYPIQKQTEGIYVVAKGTGSVKVSELQAKAKTDKTVLRFLLTRI